jgi:hypothetical protein
VRIPLAAAVACLAFVGPGSVSGDRLIGGPFTGYLYGGAAVALGVIVGIFVHSSRREEAASEESKRRNRGAQRSYERRNATNEAASSGTARESVRRARSGA